MRTSLSLVSQAALFTFALGSWVGAFGQATGDYRSTGNGAWNAAATWQRFDGSSWLAATAAPASTDGVITVRNGHSVTSSQGTTVDQVVVQATGVLSLAGGTFALSNGAGEDLSVDGTLALNGGILDGPGSAELQSGSTFNWTSGEVIDQGVVNILSGSTAEFNGALFMRGTLNNSGTCNMNGGNIQGLFGPHTFNNLSGGVLNLNGWTNNSDSWSIVVLNNSGTINKNNGSVEFTFNSCISTNNSGATINANDGIFSISSGTFTNNGSLVFNGANSVLRTTGTFTQSSSGSTSGMDELRVEGGSCTFAAGTTVNDPAQIAVSNGNLNTSVVIGTPLLNQTSGGIQGPAAIEVHNNGTFNWTGGEVLDQGVVNILSGSTGVFNGALFMRGTLNNSGTCNMNGGNIQGLFGPHIFNNLSGGVLNLNGWTNNSDSWSIMVLNNSGTINKNNGSVELTFNSCISTNNSGATINANDGTFSNSSGTFTNNGSLVFNGANAVLRNNGVFTQSSSGSTSGMDELRVETGDCTFAAGTTVSAPAQISVSNGNLNTSVVISTPLLNQTGGNIQGPAAIAVHNNGTFNWTGGALTDLGVVNILSGSTAEFNGMALLRGTLNNSGTCNMTGGHVQGIFGQHTFNNLSGGVLNLNGWTDNINTWNTVVLNNSGTINKNNGNVQFDFSGCTLSSSPGALMNVPDGALLYTGGTVNPQDGEYLIGATGTLNSTVDIPFIGPLFDNAGQVIAPQLSFQGTTAQTLGGGGHVRYLRQNGSGGTTLVDDHTVDSVLTLMQGKLNVDAFDLTIARIGTSSIAGPSANSYVVATGTGALNRHVNDTPHVFPIGTATSYMPATLDQTTGAVEMFSARMVEGVFEDFGAPGVPAGAAVTTGNVANTWVIEEATPGGTSSALTLQWNATDHQPLFSETSCALAFYTGADYDGGGLAAAGGAGPFTRTRTVSNFREFAVAGTPSVIIGTGVPGNGFSQGLRVYPNPSAGDVRIDRADGNVVRYALLDATGRLIHQETVNSNTFQLERNGLAAGSYQLVLYAQQGSIGKVRLLFE